VGSRELTGTLAVVWGTAMSWKEMLLIYLIVCALLIAYVARHFLGDALYLVEHVIATRVGYMPSVIHFVAHCWR
jgi:hypothetical protein